MINYIKSFPDGTFQSTADEPNWGTENYVSGDVYDIKTQMWYTDDTLTTALDPQPTYLPYQFDIVDGQPVNIDAYDIPTLVEPYVRAKNVKAEKVIADKLEFTPVVYSGYLSADVSVVGNILQWNSLIDTSSSMKAGLYIFDDDGV